MASHGLGESERGLLQYYGGPVTRRIEVDPGAATACPVLIEQQRLGIADGPDPVAFGCPGKAEAWRGARPEDRRNVFRVCRAAP